MRKSSTLLICGLCVLLQFAGCRRSADNSRGAGVINGSRGQFPAFLVGRWDSEEGGWKVVFEADGTISSVGIPITQGKLIPNQTTVVEMDNGIKDTFKLRDCIASYRPQTRELTVSIDVEYFRVANLFEGGGNDVFVGTVSADGLTWEANWYSRKSAAVDANGLDKPVPVVFEKVECPFVSQGAEVK